MLGLHKHCDIHVITLMASQMKFSNDARVNFDPEIDSRSRFRSTPHNRDYALDQEQSEAESSRPAFVPPKYTFKYQQYAGKKFGRNDEFPESDQGFSHADSYPHSSSHNEGWGENESQNFSNRGTPGGYAGSHASARFGQDYGDYANRQRHSDQEVAPSAEYHHGRTEQPRPPFRPRDTNTSASRDSWNANVRENRMTHNEGPSQQSWGGYSQGDARQFNERSPVPNQRQSNWNDPSFKAESAPFFNNERTQPRKAFGMNNKTQSSSGWDAGDSWGEEPESNSGRQNGSVQTPYVPRETKKWGGRSSEPQNKQGFDEEPGASWGQEPEHDSGRKNNFERAPYVPRETKKWGGASVDTEKRQRFDQKPGEQPGESWGEEPANDSGRQNNFVRAPYVPRQTQKWGENQQKSEEPVEQPGASWGEENESGRKSNFVRAPYVPRETKKWGGGNVETENKQRFDQKPVEQPGESWGEDPQNDLDRQNNFARAPCVPRETKKWGGGSVEIENKPRFEKKSVAQGESWGEEPENDSGRHNNFKRTPYVPRETKKWGGGYFEPENKQGPEQPGASWGQAPENESAVRAPYVPLQPQKWGGGSFETENQQKVDQKPAEQPGESWGEEPVNESSRENTFVRAPYVPQTKKWGSRSVETENQQSFDEQPGASWGEEPENESGRQRNFVRAPSVPHQTRKWGSGSSQQSRFPEVQRDLVGPRFSSNQTDNTSGDVSLEQETQTSRFSDKQFSAREKNSESFEKLKSAAAKPPFVPNYKQNTDLPKTSISESGWGEDTWDSVETVVSPKTSENEIPEKNEDLNKLSDKDHVGNEISASNESPTEELSPKSPENNESPVVESNESLTVEKEELAPKSPENNESPAVEEELATQSLEGNESPVVEQEELAPKSPESNQSLAVEEEELPKSSESNESPAVEVEELSPESIESTESPAAEKEEMSPKSPESIETTESPAVEKEPNSPESNESPNEEEGLPAKSPQIEETVEEAAEDTVRVIHDPSPASITAEVHQEVGVDQVENENEDSHVTEDKEADQD